MAIGSQPEPEPLPQPSTSFGPNTWVEYRDSDGMYRRASQRELSAQAGHTVVANPDAVLLDPAVLWDRGIAGHLTTAIGWPVVYDTGAKKLRQATQGEIDGAAAEAATVYRTNRRASMKAAAKTEAFSLMPLIRALAEELAGTVGVSADTLRTNIVAQMETQIDSIADDDIPVPSTG